MESQDVLMLESLEMDMQKSECRRRDIVVTSSKNQTKRT